LHLKGVSWLCSRGHNLQMRPRLLENCWAVELAKKRAAGILLESTAALLPVAQQQYKQHSRIAWRRLGLTSKAFPDGSSLYCQLGGPHKNSHATQTPW